MSVTAAQGFQAAGIAAGIKENGNPDLALVVNEGPRRAAAGDFTANRDKAAPVLWSEQVLKGGAVSAVVLNSGGANACTVKYGPLTLMSNSLSYISSVTSPNGADAVTPALTNSASTPPNRSLTVPARALMSGRDAASLRTAVARPPSCSSAASRVDRVRPVISTCAPPSANNRAVARPMPLLPPVITIFLPS